MGKANLAGTIGAISGHTGSLLFLLGPSGGFVATRQTPVRTATSAQKAAQAAWSNMIKAWMKDTTPADKAGWKTFGATHGAKTHCGTTAALSSFGAFARTNATLKNAERPFKLSPPSSFSSSPPGALFLTYTPSTPPSLTVAPSAIPTASQIPVIKATGPVRYGIRPSPKATKTILLAPAGSAGPWQIAGSWEIHFGTLVTGQAITFTVHYIDFTSGAQSTSDKATIIIP